MCTLMMKLHGEDPSFVTAGIQYCSECRSRCLHKVGHTDWGPCMSHGSSMKPPLVEFRQDEAFSRRYPAHTKAGIRSGSRTRVCNGSQE